jgi:hypothetical protein
MRSLPLQARRVFRLALTMALSLATAYAMGMPLAYLAPVLALMLMTVPAPPLGIKGLLGLALAAAAMLGIGLLLTPMLENYPITGVLTIAAGLYFSTYLAVHRGKALVGTLLGVGFTLVPVAGTVDLALAEIVIKSFVFALGLAVICQWLVYPWLPEDQVPSAPPPIATPAPESSWIAFRTALIVLPPVLLALSNPAAYLPLIMKSIMLGQQGSTVSARSAGRELLGSTFVGGCLAILFWFGLKLHVSLWMLFLWGLLFALFFAARLYALAASRYPPSFWQNACVTMLILIGPAIEDSAMGKDVFDAFVTRMALFVVVTLYAWSAIALLERLRERRAAAAALTHTPEGAS